MKNQQNLDTLESLSILELFGGIGACTKALKNIGINVNVVDYVEIDKYAVKSYNAINGTNFKPQDIKEWDKDINVDLIIGGFPCQSFSIAGKRKGFEDMRGTMCFEMARIIKKIKPKYFIFENVQGLLNHDKGKTIKIILEEFGKLGYEITMDCLNSKDYGVPQNRSRIYCIGRKIQYHLKNNTEERTYA